ncbi:TetR/AcrR family transcriptional regulator [Streptomyces sp. G-G2]|uniref:TetR/AcrR family transcriptional regulator n=1 Tax=Streptomyces sp. G-G2 TaxID=3046201 RepID=UPI0024BA0999|nr:TetR/AcrR family transcriptional regulator [Streptomyces sp. G-G2]MDJ0382875.1 TetR/AcrR family transcriptional regulator [Streptomyces sp. G-G2]
MTTHHERAGTKQERAGRTRNLLIEAAGEEFARRGYAGTSLTRISRSAMATIGALTFHFPAKNDLAEAVCERGHDLTADAVEEAAASTGPGGSALEALSEVTQALARLLEKQPVVRAAARLSRELPVTADWYDAWTPAVRSLLTRAYRGGELERRAGAGADPELVGVLVACLVSNLEVSVQRQYESASGSGWSVRGRLAEVWEVLWSGISRTSATSGSGDRAADPSTPGKNPSVA